jgi:hypothetical protein
LDIFQYTPIIGQSHEDFLVVRSKSPGSCMDSGSNPLLAIPGHPVRCRQDTPAARKHKGISSAPIFGLASTGVLFYSNINKS